MASAEGVNCFIGMAMGHEASNGNPHVDDATMDSKFKNDPHAASRFAKGASDYDVKMAQEALKGQDFGLGLRGFAALTGSKAEYLASWLYKPSDLYGESFVSPIMKALDDHIQKYPMGDFNAYKKEVVPIIEAFRQQNKGLIPEQMQRHFKEWLDAEAGGRSLYMKEYFKRNSSSNPVTKAIDNTLFNLVNWSGTISIFNTLEALPKMLAYAMSNADPLTASLSIIRAFAATIQKTGPNVFKRIPELDALGVYQSVDNAGAAKGGNKYLDWLRNKETKLNKLNPVDATENLLRSLAYNLGDSINPGSGKKAVEDIAFAFRPGNMPSAFLSKDGALTVQLMRFSLSSMKMYDDMLSSVILNAKRDPEKATRAAMALFSFHLMTAIQTGTRSTVPLPVWMALPEDMKDALQDVDNDTPLLNLTKYVGLDAADGVRPVGGAAFAVGGAILTNDLKNALTKFVSIPKTASEEGLTEAAGDFVESALYWNQVNRLPFINYSTVRLFKSLREAHKENEPFWDTLREANHLLPEE